VAAALEPDSVEKIERRHVQVALGEGHTRGQTTVDWFKITDGEPNLKLMLQFDHDRWRQLLMNSMR
jgi:inosine-uridine nucleoside N-ribohydrolase